MSESALFRAVETDWPIDLQGNQLQPVAADNSQPPVRSTSGHLAQALRKHREDEGLAEEDLTQRNAMEEARAAGASRRKAKSRPGQAHLDL